MIYENMWRTLRSMRTTSAVTHHVISPVSAHLKLYLFDIKLEKIPVPTLLRAPLKQEFTIIPQRPTINLSLQKTLRRGFSTIILKISRYFPSYARFRYNTLTSTFPGWRHFPNFVIRPELLLVAVTKVELKL